jgi:predicted alpha/beta-hydrolase family hydrolase
VATIETPAGPVSFLADGPDGAATTVVLAPGAGADMRAEFMEVFATGLAARDMRVVRFNFAYAEQGRKSPDRQPVLEDTYRAVVDHVRAHMSPGKLVIGGKSMGGRIASHVGTDVDGLVFLGYPLHPPGRPDRIRDAHLYELKTPMLFVEGTRDPFCPLDTLQDTISETGIDATVAVIDGGDHSFKVRASSGRSTKGAWAEVAERTVAWIDSALLHSAGRPRPDRI